LIDSKITADLVVISVNKGNKMKDSYLKNLIFRVGVGLILCMFQSCSNEDKNPTSLGNTVKDKDGNVYNTKKIGIQVWMVENLKTTKYNDGTPIPIVTDDSQWISLTTPAFCWYSNNEGIRNSGFGALYNYYAVNTGKLCPEGWHVPTTAEWNILEDYIGGQSVAGGKLKQTGTSNWRSPNTGATDEFGFSALPGGGRIANNGYYRYINEEGNWWTSNGSVNNGDLRSINYDSPVLSFYTSSKRNGYSIRCIKD
jgi:uncharacterized protein (TIGR02145 family)